MNANPAIDCIYTHLMEYFEQLCIETLDQQATSPVALSDSMMVY